jgi:hypothetical protein
MDGECPQGGLIGTVQVCSQDACGHCVDRCVEGTCGDGYRCRDTGHCTHERCDADGAVCPPQSTCMPNASESDAAGCLHEACTSDAQCQGKCVHGRCYASFGRCVPTLCP